MDEITAIVRDAEEEELSIDRRIAIAQAHAMLSVAQELSSLNAKSGEDIAGTGARRSVQDN
jgi:hypothetical protein